MEKINNKQDDLLRRPLYVYDLPPEVLSTLTLKNDAETHEQQRNAEQFPPPSPSERPQTPSGSESAVGAQACSLCGLTFATLLDQKGHLKSDLHAYNLKQKLRGQKYVSEVEFEKLIGDLDESLSGSDSEESEDEDDKKETTLTALLKKQATLAEKSNTNDDGNEEEWSTSKKRGTGSPPLLWFSSPILPVNNYFGLYRAIFTSEELAKEGEILGAIKTRQLPPLAIPKVGKDGSLPPVAYKGPHIFLCMIGGGHFAAMVVALAPRQTKNNNAGPMNREATVLAHKTFHRYTTRRKQGGSQSANDNAKGAAHSAGAGIRRYNEQALVDDVRALLNDWKGLLDSSDLLFIRATGATNRRTLFGPYDGQVLRASDHRIRSFPFSTRRATQNELMRSFIELTRLKVREILPVDPAALDTAAKPSIPSKPLKPTAPKLTEEEETALLHTSQLQALIRRSKLPAVLSYLKTKSLAPSFLFQPIDANHHAPTPLHFAAAQNSAPLVSGLLVRGGADPTLPNADGKMSFELAGDRATRDAFRVARHELGESAWDWEAAKVPPAMKKDEAEKREERERKDADRKEAERRKAEQERLKSEGPKVDDKAAAARRKFGVLGSAVEKSAEEKRREEARGLTPEQRMRLERERRARAAEERLRRMQAGG